MSCDCVVPAGVGLIVGVGACQVMPIVYRWYWGKSK